MPLPPLIIPFLIMFGSSAMGTRREFVLLGGSPV
jgi:hypothetical protein